VACSPLIDEYATAQSHDHVTNTKSRKDHAKGGVIELELLAYWSDCIRKSRAIEIVDQSNDEAQADHKPASSRKGARGPGLILYLRHAGYFN